MAALLRPGVFGVVVALGLAVSPLRVLAAGQQQPAREPPGSLERIRQRVEQAPARPLDVRVAPAIAIPIATFKVEVQRRSFLTLAEQLHKEFDLTALQRQSQEWESKCCGLDLGALIKPVGRALKRREERRIREQIARELSALRAAPEK